MNGKRWFVPPGWLVAWALSLLFLLLGLLLSAPPYHLRYTRIRNQKEMPVRVVTYYPSPAVYPRAPAAILCQPLNNPPEAARLLALELVRDGFVVLTFDWRGQAPEENRQLLRSGTQDALRADMLAAAAYLRSLPEVDPERIVVAGHSVGGTLAIEAALADPRIAAVAAIGMEADVTPEEPRNLLWAVGLYDEFRVLNRMRDFFQASAGTVAMENTTVGAFVPGRARRLGVSPTADHFTELQDRNIHLEVRRWFEQSTGLPTGGVSPWLETRSLLLLLAWLSALLGLIGFTRVVAGGRRWVLRIALASALLGVVLLSRMPGPHFLLTANIIWGLMLFSLLAGFVSSCSAEGLRRGYWFAARIGLVVWASVFVTLAVNNVANYIHEPRYLLWLPEFAVRHILELLRVYLLIYPRSLLFSAYDPQGLSPRLWVYALMGVELLSPGLLLGLVARVVRRRSRPARQRRPLPLASMVLLFGLVAVLAGVSWMRLEQGFLTGQSALAALRFLMRFAVLPLFVFIFLWRHIGKGPQPRAA